MDTALQSSVYVSSPEFAGWLVKRGFHWRKLWKKRWVALHGAELVYMDKEPTLENSASMTITKAQITSATVIDRDDIDGNPNGFAIHINDGHSQTWYLRAESAREKKSWMMRLGHVHAIVRWLEDFEKVKVLGVGGTGIVYSILHKVNGTQFAMKEMEIKNKTQMTMAVSEAEMLKDIMENVSHPNVMHIEKVFQVGSKFYLVFPLCTGGELYEHIVRRGHFTEHDAAVITRDLISGLQALHQHDILHLDIKPENILFDSDADDAKIKITDFGLSKLFSNVLEQKGEFSEALMAEKLRDFNESGELNRERLRGTIGYMAPELILTGHCSKATDVFAAGVVLYILLCGRPPFNSKSNREVLEKTAKGIFKMTGAEWDDISEDAKDLVKRMLVPNPNHRISTEDILAHPWIRSIDDYVSDDSSSNDASSLATGSLTSRQNTFNRKGSGLNLAGTLRLLSAHVQHLKSEKLATSVTRLVSSIGKTKSSLSQLYLLPAQKKTKASPSASVDRSASKSRTVSSGAPSEVSESDTAVSPAGNESDETDNDDDCNADLDMMLMNNDLRLAITNAVANLGDADGKLTIEQFLVVLKHLHSVTSGGGNNSNAGLVPLLIARFVDRDNDGLITSDDIFAAQAMMMQRSEAFLKIIFRVYTESMWYPGRQLNLMNIVQNTPMKGPNSAPVVGPGSPTATMHKSHSAKDMSGAGGASSGGTKVMDDGSLVVDVVEPPKFITARHVSAVFEKLGYDASAGQKVFTLLCEALARIKYGERDRSGTMDDADDDSVVRYSQANNTPLPSIPEGRGKHSNSVSAAPNAALAAAFGDDSAPDPPSPTKSSRKPPTAPETPSSKEDFNSPLMYSTTRMRAASNAKVGSAGPPPADESASSKSGGSSGGAATPGGSVSKMDVKDFMRAVELDDIFLQAIFRKSRNKMMSLVRKAESRYISQLPGETTVLSPANLKSNDANLRQSTKGGDSDKARDPRRNSADITTAIIEDELRAAFQQLKTNDGKPVKQSFPIAKAVGRATLSAAFGLAAKITSGTQALMEATYETMEGGENGEMHRQESDSSVDTLGSNPPQASSHSAPNTPKYVKREDTGHDSDDDV